MNINIFTISEIISIVMEKVDNMEKREIYGLDDTEYLSIPKPINDKLEILNPSNYEDFMNKISEISEEILPMKSGELNELNCCHQEITFLANDLLQRYIKN